MRARGTKELKMRLSIICSEGYVHIGVIDDASGEVLVDTDLDPYVFAGALGGNSSNHITGRVGELSRVGLQMVHTRVSFPLPFERHKSKDELKTLRYIAQEFGPEGCICDDGFCSQGTFFKEDDREWATAIVRCWVKPEDAEQWEKDNA